MTLQTYSVTDDGKAIKCSLCGRVSHNANDVAYRYCGACHLFHEDLSGALDRLVQAAREDDRRGIHNAEKRLLAYIRGAVQSRPADPGTMT